MAGPVTRPRRLKPVQQPSRPAKSRHARKRVKYTEPTATDPEDDESDSSFASNKPPPHPRTRSTAPLPPSSPFPTPRKHKSRNHNRKGRPNNVKLKSFGAVRPDQRESRQHKSKVEIQFTGKTMPWQTLPYHVLEIIFDYASYPLTAENYAPNPSSFWLLGMAKLCRGFAEPALTALYTSPPLFPPSRLEKLIGLLAAQNEGLSIPLMNYTVRIKNIDLEAVNTFSKKSDAADWNSLRDLLVNTTKIRRIGIHLLSDNAKFTDRLINRRIGNGAYPATLLNMLEDAGVQLKEWVWNQQVHSHPYSFDVMETLERAHLSRPFQTLRSLKFVNLTQYRLRDDSGQYHLYGDAIVRALKTLPNLRHLGFWRAELLDHLDLSLLPQGLHSLEIMDSPIEFEHMERFLQANGQSLRNIVLDHNQHLSLSWMCKLAEYCPNLEHLKMDLIYHSPFLVVSNIEPQYDALLRPFETPSWPPKLRNIELYHLRKWSIGVAGDFFQSLVNASSTLPDLRTIRIKASINESGWRERKDFKDRWIETLDKVFLYDAPPPNPHWTSIAAYREWKARASSKIKIQIPVRSAQNVNGIHDTNGVKSIHVSDDSDKTIATRRSTRKKASPLLRTIDIASSSPYSPSSDTNEEFVTAPADPSTSANRATPALTNGTPTLTTNPPTLTLAKPRKPFIQGKCTIVDLKIDSQRPMEEQLHESDFLDAEVSGDEDWNGDGDDDFEGEDGGYAW